jgi:RNA polymerase sigma-70 factor (ECF subfamily)
LADAVLKCGNVGETSSATTLLHAWREGDRSALDRLVPLVYSELRRMAGAYIRNERAPQTLEPTALVHEAYLRLVGTSDPDFTNRAHFLAIAARVMRQILVGRARARNATKRSAGLRVPLEEDSALTGQKESLVISLDDALTELEKQDTEKAKILELKYFGGLTAEDSAALLDVSVHKINRQMRLAQAWLRRELESATPANLADDKKRSSAPL